MAGFYMTSNLILTFSDDPEDIDKIRFNHYIARKENAQRLKRDLPRGQFYFAEMSAVKDLGISRRQVRSLVALFEDFQIITRIYRPKKGSHEPSIFRYNAVLEFWEGDEIRKKRPKVSDINDFSEFQESENPPEMSDFKAGHENEHEVEHEVGHEKTSDINGLNDSSGHENEHEVEHEVGQSKKQLLKTINNNSSFFENIWKEYPNKKGKSQISKTTLAKLNKVGEEKLLMAITNYKQELAANIWQKPMYGSTFFNGRYEDYLPGNYEGSGSDAKQPEQRRTTRILNEE